MKAILKEAPELGEFEVLNTDDEFCCLTGNYCKCLELKDLGWVSEVLCSRVLPFFA
jgi:hypothetical protein